MQSNTLPSRPLITTMCGGGFSTLQIQLCGRIFLSFSLPALNGKLERVFSLLGTIKVDKRSRLTNKSLDNLLLLKSDKIPLSCFNADPSIDLWLAAKGRRPSQKKKKEYQPRRSDAPHAPEDSSEDSKPGNMLGSNNVYRE